MRQLTQCFLDDLTWHMSQNLPSNSYISASQIHLEHMLACIDKHVLLNTWCVYQMVRYGVKNMTLTIFIQLDMILYMGACIPTGWVWTEASINDYEKYFE